MFTIDVIPEDGYTVYCLKFNEEEKDFDLDALEETIGNLVKANRSKRIAIRAVFRTIHDRDIRGVYEFKTLEIADYPNYATVIRSETGLPGDEETLAGIIGRTCRRIKIGKNGGLKSQKERAGNWTSKNPLVWTFR